MKKKLIKWAIVGAVAYGVIAYGSWSFSRWFNYSFQYKGQVVQTINETVKAECIK